MVRRAALRGLCGLALAAALALAGCQAEPEGKSWQGYVEAEMTYLASTLGGHLEELSIERGQRVAAGQPAFRLEAASERHTLAEAQGKLSQAKAKLADMQKGARPSELAEVEAALRKAKAALDLSTLNYKRKKKLYQDNAVPKAEYDNARAAYERDQAQAAELQARLATAKLGARTDAIAAARDEVRALEAKVAQAQWALGQKSLAAPQAGLVFDTFYVPGELVPAGRPVAAVITPGRLKVRFFVPEPDLSGLEVGQKVTLGCDGCPDGLTAEISYISPQAEYTPPVIYSNDTRAKLVFMIEAKPPESEALKLHPGQPMTVRPAQRPARP